MNKHLLLYSLFFFLLFSSCATLYTGTRKAIHFSSDPQEAVVYINGKEIGKTPLTVNVKRSLGKKVVTIEKEGFETQKIKLDKKFVPISLLSNILIPVDLVSGALVNFKDQYYHKELSARNGNLSKESPLNLNKNFYVITYNDTLCTKPFQDFTKEWVLSDYLKDMNFTLVDGTEQILSVSDIHKYKTLEIDKRGIGLAFLYLRTNIKHYESTYIRVKIDEKKNKQLYTFMEEMLYQNDYQIVSSYAEVKPFLSKVKTKGSYYYLAKNGEVIGIIEQEKLLATVRQFFGEEKELINRLKSKNKFKVLKKYITEKKQVNSKKEK